MEAIDFAGPDHQAKHLARYISCPSTIHAHCVNNWGRSPDVMRIKEWQAGFRKPMAKVGEPTDRDALVPRIGLLPVEKPKPVRVAVERIGAPKQRKTLWPVWYTPPCTVFLASELIRSVAKSFGLTSNDLTGKGREQIFIHARAVAIRIMRDRGWSYPRIGAVLGGRDHSTTINSARNFDIYQRQNDQVAAVYLAHRDAGWCGHG